MVRLTSAVVKSTNLPVTVKTRLDGMISQEYRRGCRTAAGCRYPGARYSRAYRVRKCVQEKPTGP